MSKKKLILLLSTIITLPWVFNFIDIYPSIYLENRNEINFSSYFESVKNFEPLYRYGNYTFGEYNWLPYIIITYILSIFFGATGGIAYICILLLLGFLGLYKLLVDYYPNSNKNHKLYSALLAFIFVTSPSIFLYFKSTIALTAPALLFPLQLYLLLNYLKTGKTKNIFLIFLIFLSLLYCNITTLILNPIFLFLLGLIYYPKKWLKSGVALFFSVIPILITSAVIIYISMKTGYVETADLVSSIREDFYFQNNNLLNIFKQTADWGFFSGFGENLYFSFSKYYKIPLVGAIGVLFSILLLYSIVFHNKSSSKKYYILLIIFIVVMMLGTKTSVYNFLYNNFPAFHIFRNIQKFAPFLLIVLIISASRFYSGNIIKVIIILGLIYNIPYFIYSSVFTSERTFSGVSTEWEMTSNILNEKSTELYTKVLALPAVYTNEEYENNNKKVVVGVLGDYLINGHFHRLSPQLNGDYYTQIGMKKVFERTNKNLYGITPNFNELEKFINDFKYTHILVTFDVIEKFGDTGEYVKYFSQNKNFSTIYYNSKHIIFEKNNIRLPENTFIKKIGKVKYSLYIKNLKTDKITSLESFHPEWNIYITQKPSIKTVGLFQDSHKKIFDFGNSWVASNKDIVSYVKKYYSQELKKEGYPKTLSDGRTDYKYYIENPDGSIDVELTLYFKPQLYFYIGLIISGTTFALLFLWILIDSILQRRKVKKRKVDNGEKSV